MPYVRFPVNNFTSDSIIRKQPFLTILYKRPPIDVQQFGKFFIRYILLSVKQRPEIRNNRLLKHLYDMMDLLDQPFHSVGAALGITNHLRL